MTAAGFTARDFLARGVQIGTREEAERPLSPQVPNNAGYRLLGISLHCLLIQAPL
jgi:hypothetical protein